jgi:hypothetical protein
MLVTLTLKSFPPTVMPHLISASVRLRFTLNVVTSHHVTRGIESSTRFAECRDPNSQSVHTSVDARRVATHHAPLVANQQACLFADSWGQWLFAFVRSLETTLNATYFTTYSQSVTLTRVALRSSPYRAVNTPSQLWKTTSQCCTVK